MDTHERIHLISAKTDAEVEVTVIDKWLKKIHCPCNHTKVLDLKQVELVYSSSFFKSIETGGNVSKALVEWLVVVHDTSLQFTSIYLHFFS